MLDLLQSRKKTCEKCGEIRQCAHIVLWDGSFAGWVCWIELMKLVNEASKDPEHRKKQAAHRHARRPGKPPHDVCHYDHCCSHCAERSKAGSMGDSWSCSCPCCSKSYNSSGSCSGYSRTTTDADGRSVTRSWSVSRGEIRDESQSEEAQP